MSFLRFLFRFIDTRTKEGEGEKEIILFFLFFSRNMYREKFLRGSENNFLQFCPEIFFCCGAELDYSFLSFGDTVSGVEISCLWPQRKCLCERELENETAFFIAQQAKQACNIFSD